jgi:uncharacterized membrane protein YdjX (TVP38/TMEM64 family)
MKNAARMKQKQMPWKWIGLGVAGIGLLVAMRMLPVGEWLKAFNEWVTGFGPWGIVIFIGVYILATVVFVPGSALTIGAGLIFGLLWGTVAVSIGSTTGAALSFLIARYLARDAVSARMGKNEKFAAIDRAIGEQGWKIVALLRLSPLVPFNLSNYFYGLTAVKFWPYVLASWIAMLPGTVLYVYLGYVGKASLEAASGATQRSPLEYVFMAVGLAATVAVTVYVTRLAKQALNKTKVIQAT